MPTWRKLHVKTIDSVDINEMPDDFHRLTWVMLPLILDSAGRAIDNSAWLRSKLYPMRQDVTSEQVEAAVAWCAGRGMIERYEVGGRRYFWVPTFEKYQGKTDREALSVIPEQAKKSPKNKARQVKSNSGPTHDQGPDWSSLDVDVDVDVEEMHSANAPAPAVKSREADPVFDAIVSVCGVDLTIDGAGKSVGSVASALKKAKPPYTAPEILAWGKGQAWRTTPPTVWQLKSGVSTIRVKTPGGAKNNAPKPDNGMKGWRGPG